MKELPKFTPPPNQYKFSDYFIDTITSLPIICFAIGVAVLTIYLIGKKKIYDAIVGAIIMVFAMLFVALFIAADSRMKDYNEILIEEQKLFHSKLYEGHSKEFLMSYRISPEVGRTEKRIATEVLNEHYTGWSVNDWN